MIDGGAKTLEIKDDTVSTLYAGDLGRVEYLACSGRRRGRGGRASAKHLHIVLPLAGSFVWHPGKQDYLVDSATVLFAGADQDFAISHPVSGDRSLVIWPSALALEAATGCDAKHWKQHPAFVTRTRRTTGEIQVVERALIAACVRSDDTLKIEEILSRLLALLVDDSASGTVREGAGAQRTVARAKLLLQERMPERLTLADVAREVGVSPVYLTQLFRSVEGLPLYQYALNLRMSAALDALAESDDITRLAIDFGFSSHSHFTAAFRARFGTPPSALRAELRHDDATSPALFLREVRPLCVMRGGLSGTQWA